MRKTKTWHFSLKRKTFVSDKKILYSVRSLFLLHVIKVDVYIFQTWQLPTALQDLVKCWWLLLPVAQQNLPLHKQTHWSSPHCVHCPRTKGHNSAERPARGWYFLSSEDNSSIWCSGTPLLKELPLQFQRQFILYEHLLFSHYFSVT